MFDITTQAVALTAPLHLKDAAGNLLYTSDRKPVRIHLHGPASPEYARIEERQTQRALKRAQDNDGKATAPSSDDRRAQIAEDYAAVTVAFENFNYPPAGDVMGAEAFRATYADPTLGFIVNQITKFLADWGNFKPASGAN
ncbi:hypothetical protein [Sphingomonas paucimobilis]|uniref:hypothetical protein n=1 Tax=Sphingomonas paucimobilis TaxID=13689 RepID=UPI00064BFB3A|nr:hypothetical protein [Sphingomonas paucimobilis]